VTAFGPADCREATSPRWPGASSSSAFARIYFPCDVIVLAVRWYLRFNLSYRDLKELLAERGIEVDHTTIDRWFQRFTPLLADAAPPSRHAVGGRWQVDETSCEGGRPVARRWTTLRSPTSCGNVSDRCCR
jgi:transposase-like protein